MFCSLFMIPIIYILLSLASPSIITVKKCKNVNIEQKYCKNLQIIKIYQTGAEVTRTVGPR